jgi:hypothetical protein
MLTVFSPGGSMTCCSKGGGCHAFLQCYSANSCKTACSGLTCTECVWMVLQFPRQPLEHRHSSTIKPAIPWSRAGTCQMYARYKPHGNSTLRGVVIGPIAPALPVEVRSLRWGHPPVGLHGMDKREKSKSSREEAGRRKVSCYSMPINLYA